MERFFGSLVSQQEATLISERMEQQNHGVEVVLLLVDVAAIKQLVIWKSWLGELSAALYCPVLVFSIPVVVSDKVVKTDVFEVDRDVWDSASPTSCPRISLRCWGQSLQEFVGQCVS